MKHSALVVVHKMIISRNADTFLSKYSLQDIRGHNFCYRFTARM